MTSIICIQQITPLLVVEDTFGDYLVFLFGVRSSNFCDIQCHYWFLFFNRPCNDLSRWSYYSDFGWLIFQALISIWLLSFSWSSLDWVQWSKWWRVWSCYCHKVWYYPQWSVSKDPQMLSCICKFINTDDNTYFQIIILVFRREIFCLGTADGISILSLTASFLRE